MDSWVLTENQKKLDFSGIISTIGEYQFGNELLKNLTQSAHIDFLSVYSLDQTKRPKMFLSASSHDIDVSAECFKKYLTGIYSRDHTFDRAKSIKTLNETAVTHWHESEFPKDHRNAIYSSFDILDRLSLVDASLGKELIAINFYRHKGQNQFNDNEIDIIQSSASEILASIRKHIQITTFDSSPKLDDEANIQQSLRSLYPELSDRELQICSGLLMGRTYEGIATDLGISLATVKTYRARAYEKLGIHFKSELFGTAKLLVLREFKNNV